jgi:hypothetical protein
MPNTPIPFPSRTNPGSGSAFMRKRLILNVANLRYEFDVICILTPLPPKPITKLAVLAPANAEQNKRRRQKAMPSVPSLGEEAPANNRNRRIRTIK